MRESRRHGSRFSNHRFRLTDRFLRSSGWNEIERLRFMASTLGFARLTLACATRVISGAAPNSAIRAGAACACSAAPAIAMPRAVARKMCAFMGFFLNVARPHPTASCSLPHGPVSAFYRGGQPPLVDLDQTGALPSRGQRQRSVPRFSSLSPGVANGSSAQLDLLLDHMVNRCVLGGEIKSA